MDERWRMEDILTEIMEARRLIEMAYRGLLELNREAHASRRKENDETAIHELDIPDREMEKHSLPEAGEKVDRTDGQREPAASRRECNTAGEAGAEEPNARVRQAMREAGVRQWQIAEVIGMSESSFCLMMKREMAENKQKKLIRIIGLLKR